MSVRENSSPAQSVVLKKTMTCAHFGRFTERCEVQSAGGNNRILATKRNQTAPAQNQLPLPEH